MQVINVYKYVRPDGGVTVSPVEPTCEYTQMVRLVADEGKALTLDGTSLTISADVNSTDGWYEVDAQEVIPEWEQPGSANPYMTGDKVTHLGKTWVCTMDYNVYEPGIAGWSEVTE